ncbi:hypothetical protein BMS3Abin15_01159 [bacterium BMS3Abin15]|nr:hypothetical protein BMS3Abin15_01159 [bacterium BMS3Abin15]
MGERKYYSMRTGKNPNPSGYDLNMLKRLFRDLFNGFMGKDYFQEAFGYWCVDADEVPGILGSDVEAQIFRRVRKENLWPIGDKCQEYSEDDLFDVIEFLYDYVSKPVDGYFHSFGGCRLGASLQHIVVRPNALKSLSKDRAGMFLSSPEMSTFERASTKDIFLSLPKRLNKAMA